MVVDQSGFTDDLDNVVTCRVSRTLLQWLCRSAGHTWKVPRMSALSPQPSLP
jgi:hypothetical protein